MAGKRINYQILFLLFALIIKLRLGLLVTFTSMTHGYFCFFSTWQAEVNYLGDLLHPNLVKLIGYCIEDDQRLLVYEFMPRGSLENHLFRSMNFGSHSGISYPSCMCLTL